MEFGWAEDQVKFRQRVRDLLDRELPAEWPEIRKKGKASPEQAAFGKQFAPKLAAENLLVNHWPKEFGGGDGPPWEHFILGEELWGRGEPRGPQYMNVNWIGPALMASASPEQQAKYLPPMTRGDVVWCQLFSEPGAGSDLASMRTRAEPLGNGRYLVNGMKLWTSYAKIADYGFLLAKTGPAKKDVSVFLVPMNAPGITVRPFTGLVEDGHCNEVYFDNVEVSVEDRVGEEGMAWDVVRYALAYERVGVQRYHMVTTELGIGMAELKRQDRLEDPGVLADAGMTLAAAEACRMISYDVVAQRAKDATPNEDASVARMAMTECTRSMNSFIARYLPEAISCEKIGGDYGLYKLYQFIITSSIAAGAYEIQCDVVATRQLGLSRGG
jgi:alkylation response protein AidB-like acyl-CoA dehydrogenase